MGAPPTREWQGRDDEQIILSGKKFITSRGDVRALQDLEIAAGKSPGNAPDNFRNQSGKSLAVFYGGNEFQSGIFAGRFVVDEISTSANGFRLENIPLKIDFRITISEAAE